MTPDWIRDSDAESNEAVERLMRVGRHRAAFSCVRFKPAKLGAQILFRLLSAMAQGGDDQPGEYMPEHYHLEKAFEHLNASPALTLAEKAGLESAYD